MAHAWLKGSDRLATSRWARAWRRAGSGGRRRSSARSSGDGTGTGEIGAADAGSDAAAYVPVKGPRAGARLSTPALTPPFASAAIAGTSTRHGRPAVNRMVDGRSSVTTWVIGAPTAAPAGVGKSVLAAAWTRCAGSMRQLPCA